MPLHPLIELPNYEVQCTPSQTIKKSVSKPQVDTLSNGCDDFDNESKQTILLQ